MLVLRGVHLASLILWFGSAAVDGLLELLLRRKRTRDGQLALYRLHRRIDLTIEAPFALLAVGTGLAMALQRGVWTPALHAKMACAAVALLANLWCAVLVVRRDAWASTTTGPAPGQTDVGRRFERGIFATGLAMPFGVAAFVLAIYGA